jgi:hypothetical protein
MQIQRTDHPCKKCRACRGFNKDFHVFIIALLCVIFYAPAGYAQSDSFPFQSGEELRYDIHYKYGLVMLKGGTAKYRINSATYAGRSTYRSSLDFKTTSFFDKIFKIRDTLNSYVSVPNLVPIYHNRSVNEGSTHFTEKIFMQKHSASFSEAHIIQERKSEIKLDTVLSVNNLGYDILNIFMFIRTLDISEYEAGESFQCTVFIGKRKVNIITRYAGQAIIEKNNSKYKTHKFNIDIADEVFNESKNSMEVWLSDDENRIPVKLKAKLKIGAAEADLSSYKNLKNPFSSEIKILPR